MPIRDKVISTSIIGKILFTDSKMNEKVVIAKILLCSSFGMA